MRRRRCLQVRCKRLRQSSSPRSGSADCRNGTNWGVSPASEVATPGAWIRSRPAVSNGPIRLVETAANSPQEQSRPSGQDCRFRGVGCWLAETAPNEQAQRLVPGLSGLLRRPAFRAKEGRRHRRRHARRSGKGGLRRSGRSLALPHCGGCRAAVDQPAGASGSRPEHERDRPSCAPAQALTKQRSRRRRRLCADPPGCACAAVAAGSMRPRLLCLG